MHTDLQKLIRLGEFTAEPATGQLRGPAGEQHLEPRVMDVLTCLVQHDGQVVSRETLIREVWQGRPVVDEVISRCITALRRALGDSARRPQFIETIPKRGYRLLLGPADRAASGDEVGSTPTLAVIPLQSLSPEADDDFIADGVTELLIANLATLAGLRLISRTSVMRYRGTTVPLPEIAQALGASLVIEGTVFRSGSRIQVVVQLIDAATDTHLWAGQFQRPIEDLLDLQNEVTRTIARELHLGLPGTVRRSPADSGPLLPEAMEQYLRAQWFLSKRTAADCDRAIHLLEQALAHSPRFAAAAAGLASAWIIKALYGGSPPVEAARQVDAHINASLAIEPDNPDALAARGALQLFFDRDIAGARETLDRALSINPSLVVAQLVLADTWLATADFRQALERLDTALRLSPLDLGLMMNRGDFLLAAGRTQEAVAQFEDVLEMDGGFHPARLRLAYAHALAGDAQAASAALDVAVPEGLRAKRLEAEALVAAATGNRAQGLAAARALGQLALHEYVSPWLPARAFAALGEADASFEWLERCFEERSSSLVFLAVNPAFAPLRDTSRFQAALERLGLGHVCSR